jgi:hypothetical protein
MLAEVNIKETVSGGRPQGYMQPFESRANEIITVSIFDLAKTADLANEVCRIVLR